MKIKKTEYLMHHVQLDNQDYWETQFVTGGFFTRKPTLQAARDSTAAILRMIRREQRKPTLSFKP